MSDSQFIARRALASLDLTSLNDSDTEPDIQLLCSNAISRHGSVAAVCVWPRFVKIAAEYLKDTPVKVAAVANFPAGDTDIDAAVATCDDIVAQGGDEVDVVLPYRTFLGGDRTTPATLVHACKQACGEKVVLKVILETGVLKTPEAIRQASEIALENGADFIKTSTGKVAVSATLEASRVMLETIKSMGLSAGFKAAGGIKDVPTAAAYLALADEIMGENWVSSKTFRFGASGVLKNLVSVLDGIDSQDNNLSGY